MREHVTKTIEDLRSTAAELLRMAQTLTHVFEAAELPAPVPIPEFAGQPAPATPPVPAVEATARRGRVSSRTPRSAQEKPPRDYSPKTRPSGVHAVRCAVAEVAEPFSLCDVREWMQQHNPKALAGMGKRSLSTAMFSLRKADLIRDVDKKMGPKGPVAAYKRSARFTSEPGPGMSDKERNYRELRSTMKTGEEQEAA